MNYIASLYRSTPTPNLCPDIFSSELGLSYSSLWTGSIPHHHCHSLKLFTLLYYADSALKVLLETLLYFGSPHGSLICAHFPLSRVEVFWKRSFECVHLREKGEREKKNTCKDERYPFIYGALTFVINLLCESYHLSEPVFIYSLILKHVLCVKTWQV